MPFDKKRLKEIQKMLPAVRHLIKREFCVQNVDISDALNKKKEYVPEDTDSDNYSIDNDSWDDYSSDYD